MKNEKIRFLPVFLVALLVLTMASGSVFAYMKAKTPVVENMIVPASVNCEIKETFTNNEKTSIKVKNTGNIEAYLRICFVTYWVNTDENDNEIIVSEPSKNITDFPFDDKKWKKGSNNIYYYTEAIAPGAEIEFLKNGEKIILEVDANGNRQVIEVFAEAIQSLPAEAVTESWGVTLDENGLITAVS